MVPASRIALALGISVLAAAPLLAQEATEPPTPEQLAAMERVRPLVNAIWLDVRTPPKGDEERPRYFWQVTDKLIAIGPDVVPFLASELELSDPNTFHFSAYALGQLGGPEAETALRRAVRAADARGGRFGQACKRYALYGLALLGKPDAFDLFQAGESLHGFQMTPDLPLVSHMALLIGPAGLPTLLKQLDTFGADPAATEKLEDAILATGYVGDASVVPKLIPFLSNASPKIRALAADAVARLSEPRRCELLVPLLSSADLRERKSVAHSLARWKPDPCYKAMVGRLEVEDDPGIRETLYNAMVIMGDESALDVFRLYLRSKRPYDQGDVIDAIGDVGSKKGLSMLRSLLPDSPDAIVIRTLLAIAAIGGEGALDTVLAATEDSRSTVAFSAQDIVVDLGMKKYAPEIAADLLKMVREPVANHSLRVHIAKRVDSLVTLGYTQSADDLSAAAAVQTDPDIKEALTSGVRRMRLLVKNRDDVAAWAAESMSPMDDVKWLAYRRLAEIGSPAAVRTIEKLLERPDLQPHERAHMLMSIAEARTAAAAPLVERHLADPVYDVWAQNETRAAAAWAARRLGGKRMAQALRESAVRRDGRDWATLVYLAILERGAAVETLKVLRSRRLRYPEPLFGGEEPQLNVIIEDLTGGRTLARFDLPPERLAGL